MDNFRSTKRHHYFTETKDRKEYLHPQNEEYVTKYYSNYGSKLGPLEFSLASSILNDRAKYNVLIMTGALGSGKSTLSEYVLNFLKNENLPAHDHLHFPNDGTIFRINFNDNFASDDSVEIGTEFKIVLMEQLLRLIESMHKHRLFIDDFIAKIQSGDDERFNLFAEFVRKLHRQRLPTEEAKFDFLLDWIDDLEPLSYKLRLVSYLLAFTQESKSSKKGVDFIILLDNIDRFPDTVQMELLNIVFSFSIKLPIKILMPMRLTTFGKIKGNGSYNFAVFENTGQQPIHILSLRLRHCIHNMKDYAVSTTITPSNIPRVRQKLEFVLNSINESPVNDRFSNFFTAIAGNSIRRGLGLSERFFINTAIRYNTDHLFKDDFLRSLLISENSSGKFSIEDRLVNNLFCSLNDGGENTMLNIRILQILYFFKESSLVCKMNVLLSHVALFDEYSNAQILDAINDLIFYPRRLAYVEGVNDYTDQDNLFKSMNDVINITYSGTEYLNTLLLNVVYLQHSFIAVNWKIPKSMRSLKYLEKFIEDLNHNHDNPNIRFLHSLIHNKSTTITDFISPAFDFNNLNERMKMIRECLYFLLINDLNQLAIYYENNEIQDAENIDNRYIKNSIIIDIIAKTSISVINILKAGLVNKDEIRNWYDLLIIADLWQMQVFQIKHHILETAIKTYSKEIL